MSRIKQISKLSGIFLLIFTFHTACQMAADQMISDADMNAEGVKAFEEIKAKTPIEGGAAANNYVRCVANALIAELPRSSDGSYPTGVRSWEVIVFRDNTANAFALPGGKIGVHTGLLTVATNQDQLAAVMGHEVSHVLAKHGKQRVAQHQGLGMVAGTIGPILGQQFEIENDTVETVFGYGAQYGVMLPFSRGHESEADMMGQDLMAKAGFNPLGAIQLWQNMAAAGGGGTPEFMSTHPSADTRIQDLKDNLDQTLPLYEAAKAQGKRPACG